MAYGRSLRTPFFSVTSVTLPFTAGGSFAGSKVPFDVSKLTNNFRVPLEIREVRVMLDPRPTTFAVPVTLTASPFVNLEAKLGKHYLTDGAVPVSVLAPYKVGFSSQLDSFSVYSIAGAGANISRVTTRRMVLHQPLIIPPGLGFNVVASLSGDSFWTSVFTVSFNVDVYVALIGRFLAPNDKIPATNDLPIISYTEIGSTKKSSLEEELRNPLSQDIRVRRMVMAHPTATTTVLGNQTLTTTTQIEMLFPDGSRMSENEVIWPRIFGQQRVWPVDFVLPANKRIRAKTDQTGTTTRLQIGLYGTRPEVIP